MARARRFTRHIGVTVGIPADGVNQTDILFLTDLTDLTDDSWAVVTDEAAPSFLSHIWA